jgi:chitin synthase
MRSNNPHNRPANPYAGQPQPHQRHPRDVQEMSGPGPNYSQYGPQQGSHMSGPRPNYQQYEGGPASAGFNGPPQGAHRPLPSDPGQMNRLRNDEQFHGSANTFRGSSKSLLSDKPTIRHIPLTPEGNLVVDVPVPDRVLSNAKYQSGDEFTYTRYTAVTSTPDQFPYSGYTLRQQEMQRSTELFIVVTMYNEEDDLFCKSMSALMKNIAYLCSRSKSSTWGEDGWKKAIICIVSDGRAKINRRTLDVLGIMGVYQDGIMKDSVNEKPVTAHIFEYTTQICVTQDLKVQGRENGYVPVQILFCLKEKNAKKV